MALLLHPDKNPGDEKAAENFQNLQKAYSILSDPKKRKRYDDFGDTGDGMGDIDWESAYEYFKSVHREVTEQELDDFAAQYRFSEEEKNDVIDFYL